jgi:hypothetical protein
MTVVVMVPITRHQRVAVPARGRRAVAVVLAVVRTAVV